MAGVANLDTDRPRVDIGVAAPNGDAGMLGTDVERFMNGSTATAPGPTAGMLGNVEGPNEGGSGGTRALVTTNVCWHTVQRTVTMGAAGSGSTIRIRDWHFSHVTIMPGPPTTCA